MTDTPGFRESREGDVVEFTLDRPQRRNALTAGLVRALASRLDRLGDEGVRACVLSGGPPVFCAGGDLTDLNAAIDQGPLALGDLVYKSFHHLVRSLAAAPCPIVAVIDGAALGAGLDLALSCDLRVASSRSTFASAWINVGLVPGMGGAHLLTSTIGAGRASQMVLLGERIDATQALDWGLVNSVVDAADLQQTVRAITERLISLPTAAVSLSKAALRRRSGLGLAQELAALGAIQGGLLSGDDFRERTARFRAAPAE